MDMDDLQRLGKAAELAGVTRQSVATWLKLGLLKSKSASVGTLTVALVSVKAVKELAKQRRPGRPKKQTK